MKNSYFFISKPIQYINASNITEDTPKVCVFINNMANGLAIFNELKKKSNHWDEFLFFETRMDALKEMVNRKEEIENLYLDSDYGLLIQFQLYKINANIFIYEEGFGTYTNGRRTKSLVDQVIRFANGLLGNRDYIGGYKHTKGVYVYNEDRHKAAITDFDKPRLKFNRPFLLQLKYLPEVDVFFPAAVKESLNALNHKNVAIYLAAWEIKPHAIMRLKDYKDHVKLLKPHPHLKNIPVYQEIDWVIDAYILVELLLLFLVEHCKEVVVIHEGSAFTQYVGDHENLILINVNQA